MNAFEAPLCYVNPFMNNVKPMAFYFTKFKAYKRSRSKAGCNNATVGLG